MADLTISTQQATPPPTPAPPAAPPPGTPPPSPNLVSDVGWMAILLVLIIMGLTFYAAAWLFSSPSAAPVSNRPPPHDFITQPQPATPVPATPPTNTPPPATSFPEAGSSSPLK